MNELVYVLLGLIAVLLIGFKYYQSKAQDALIKLGKVEGDEQIHVKQKELETSAKKVWDLDAERTRLKEEYDKLNK